MNTPAALLVVAALAALAVWQREAVADTLDTFTDDDMTTADLENRNVRAFLAMIRAGEGTAGPNGYRTLYGGGLFESFADHPRQKISKPMRGQLITSTAAGAYQFLARTWDECAEALGLTDFSPPSQDEAAVFLIRRRGALADVKAGRFEEAVRKCRKEWASLPGAGYGQPEKTLADARRVYESAGGAYA